MREVPSCSVSEVVEFPTLPLPPPSSSSPCETENTFGRISKDGKWAWIAHGCVLEIFSTRSKERCGIWYFGASLKSGSLNITAVEELISSHLPFPCLLVSLDSGSRGGLICLFSVKTSKVISCIQLQYKITSLAIISGSGGVTMETYPLSPQLRIFFGIAAVGTEEGNVLLLDLCLDVENYTDENKPNKALVVNRQTHNLPAKREQAIQHNQHLCIFLNDNCYKLDIFEYKNNRTLISTFPMADIVVNSIKYMRNLAVLAVGFNFGGMQLWNLRQLRLEFSLPNHPRVPLVQFAFQEPENDPRNFCYLWTVRGHYQGENYRPKSSSVAILYSLAYAKREWVHQYGFLYQNLESVTKRVEYILSEDPYSPMSFNSTSRLISCEVVPQMDLKVEAEDTLQGDDYHYAENLGLCLMAWENWLHDKPLSSCLVLFDLNQWYHAQMPFSIRCNSNSLCSYMGVFSLNDVSSKMNMASPLAISAVPNSLTKFKSLSAPEEMFFPSSFSFKMWCLSSKNFLQATYLGIQRQILLEMNTSGPNILVDPKKVYNCCVAAGLLNPTHELPYHLSGEGDAMISQREALLTLALENNMMGFLDTCIQMWKNTEFLHLGCSTKFLLDWVWKTVTKIKTSIDKLCLPLFNCSRQVLDENNLIMLRAYESRLKNLSDILQAFKHLRVSMTESGEKELQLRKGVVDSIATYLHILNWLCSCKLLPEHEENFECGKDEVAYPISRFQKTYSYRRSELQKINSSIGLNDILLIDGLIFEFGPSLASMWTKKGGSNVYPPPNIYAAVSSYLLDGPLLTYKHMLMYYLLLDMAAFLADRQSHLLDKIISFCTSNNISLSVCKLTQAFWRLDHCDFETALNLLLDPMVSDENVTPWQHLRVVKSFLFQGHPRKALVYINSRNYNESTIEEIKLHLSVLLANGMISEALKYQRKHNDGNYGKDLLKHLFLGCQQTRTLQKILRLPLSLDEYDALSDYLLNCGDPKAPEILVMFNLLRGNALEAANLNEKLVSQMMERDSKSCERAIARNALVNGFLDALPSEQKKLAHELNQIHPQIKRSNVNPRPLSTIVTTKSLTVISYSDLLRDIIYKIDETADVESGELTPFKTNKKNTETPFLCSPFIQRSLKRKRVSECAFTTPNTKLFTSESEHYITPTKKIRTTEEFSLQSPDLKSINPGLASEINLLLQTPTINKTKKVLKSSDNFEPSQFPSHSILKTKSQKLSAAPQNTNFGDKTPSIFSEDEEAPDNVYETLKDEDDQQIRQLRFVMPSPEKCKEKSMAMYSPKITPRKPLREDGISKLDNLKVVKCFAESGQSSQASSIAERSSQYEKSSEDQFFLNMSDSESETEEEIKPIESELVIADIINSNINKEQNSVESMDYVSIDSSLSVDDNNSVKLDTIIDKVDSTFSLSSHTYGSTMLQTDLESLKKLQKDKPQTSSTYLQKNDTLSCKITDIPKSDVIPESSSPLSSSSSFSHAETSKFIPIQSGQSLSKTDLPAFNQSYFSSTDTLLKQSDSHDYNLESSKVEQTPFSQPKMPSSHSFEHSLLKDINVVPIKDSNVPNFLSSQYFGTSQNYIPKYSTYVSHGYAPTIQSTTYTDLSARPSVHKDINETINESSSNQVPYVSSVLNISSEQSGDSFGLRNIFAMKPSETKDSSSFYPETHQNSTTKEESTNITENSCIITNDSTLSKNEYIPSITPSLNKGIPLFPSASHSNTPLDTSSFHKDTSSIVSSLCTNTSLITPLKPDVKLQVSNQQSSTETELQSIDSDLIILPPEKPLEYSGLRNIFSTKPPELSSLSVSNLKPHEVLSEENAHFCEFSTVRNEILTENSALIEGMMGNVDENVDMTENLMESNKSNNAPVQIKALDDKKDDMGTKGAVEKEIKIEIAETSKLSTESPEKWEDCMEVVEFHDISSVLSKKSEEVISHDTPNLRTRSKSRSKSKSPSRAKTPTFHSKKMPTTEHLKQEIKTVITEKKPEYDISSEKKVEVVDSPYLRTRSRSRSKSKSRSPSRAKTPTFHTEKILTTKSIKQDTKSIMPEKKQPPNKNNVAMELEMKVKSDDHNMYLRTRSRSKSRSPLHLKSSTPEKISPKHLREKSKSITPEKPSNVKLESEKKIIESPYLGTRSRSRSKSKSPLRAKTSLLFNEKAISSKSLKEELKSVVSEQKILHDTNLSRDSEEKPSFVTSLYIGTRSRSKSKSPSRTFIKRNTKQLSPKLSPIKSPLIQETVEDKNVIKDNIKENVGNDSSDLQSKSTIKKFVSSIVTNLVSEDVALKHPNTGTSRKTNRMKQMLENKMESQEHSSKSDQDNAITSSFTSVSLLKKEESSSLIPDFIKESSVDKTTKRISPRAKKEKATVSEIDKNDLKIDISDTKMKDNVSNIEIKNDNQNIVPKKILKSIKKKTPAREKPASKSKTEIKSEIHSEITSDKISEDNKPVTSKEETAVVMTSRKKVPTSTTKKKQLSTKTKVKTSVRKPIKDILETVAQTPPTPIAPFVFSPPSTRLRIRQKQHDESMADTTLTDLFHASTSTKDEEKIGIKDETKSLVTPKKRVTSHAKRTNTKKRIRDTNIQTPKADINLISPIVSSSDDTTSSRTSIRLSSTNHSMILRKTKRKSVKLF